MPPIYTNTTLNYKRQPRLTNPVQQTLGDPYLNNVVLFLKGDGTDGSTNIVDSSLNALTPYSSNATLSTTQKKYGESSIFFNDAQLISYSNVGGIFDFDTNDFTIECWMYLLALADFDTPFSGRQFPWLFFFGGKFYLRNDKKELITPTNHGLSVNTWIHLALTRSGNTYRIFRNGALVVTGTNSSSRANTYLDIGGMQTHRFTGYVDSLRVTLGTCRYTENFDPETDTYLDM